MILIHLNPDIMWYIHDTLRYSIRHLHSFINNKKNAKKLVEVNGCLLYYLDSSTKTNELCELAVKNNGMALMHVIKSQTYTTPSQDLCLMAVNNNGHSIQFVGHHFRSKCRDIAVTQNGCALRHFTKKEMSEISKDTLKKAICQNGCAIIYAFPEKSMAEVLQNPTDETDQLFYTAFENVFEVDTTKTDENFDKITIYTNGGSSVTIELKDFYNRSSLCARDILTHKKVIALMNINDMNERTMLYNSKLQLISKSKIYSYSDIFMFNSEIIAHYKDWLITNNYSMPSFNIVYNKTNVTIGHWVYNMYHIS